VDYNYEGSSSYVEKEIKGDDSTILFSSAKDVSIGKNYFGEEPVGTTSSEISTLSRFISKRELGKQDFYELRITYSSNSIDDQWEITSHGGNVTLTTADDVTIKG